MAIFNGLFQRPVKVFEDEQALISEFNITLRQVGRKLIKINSFRFTPYDGFLLRVGDCQIQYEFVKGKKEKTQNIVGF